MMHTVCELSGDLPHLKDFSANNFKTFITSEVVLGGVWGLGIQEKLCYSLLCFIRSCLTPASLFGTHIGQYYPMFGMVVLRFDLMDIHVPSSRDPHYSASEPKL